MNVIKVYDNGGETIDRYTVVTDTCQMNGEYLCLGLSNNPESPHGFSQWHTCLLGVHLGTEIDLTDLSIPLREHIKQRIRIIPQ